MNPDATPTPPAGSQPKEAPSNLRLRVIWASLAAALLIACTFGGPISFGLFFAAVQAVMLKEFYRIMRASGYRPASWLGIIVSLLFIAVTAAGVYYMLGPSIFSLGTITTYEGQSASDAASQRALADHMTASFWTIQAWGLLLSAFTINLVLIGLVGILREIVLWPNHGKPFSNIGATIMGLLYVTFPMTLLLVLAFYPDHYDPRRVFLLIFFIWAADTGAYFAGKNFGKHKLAPSISPGKTWEGWAGGAALTLLVGWAAGYFLPDIPLSHRLVAAGVVAVFGPLGDLAESMLKRSAGVKDSGTFLPGHGGLLDRFDAFLLVLPVLALLQALLG